MKRLVCGVILLSLLALTTLHQAEVLRQRPVDVKLGPVLSPTLVKLFADEYATTLAIRSVVRVMFYFGSFFGETPNAIQESPEYASMYNHLIQAVKLDPYNLDAYYFAQASFTWEVGRAREVNQMLDYGMKYRTSDYMLPFYAGFNSAYFLHDYAAAARYFQVAADRSGNSLFANLAARYFHESGQTALGLAFLDTMIDGAKDKRTRLIYEKRRDALLAIRLVEQALARYRQQNNHDPKGVDELLAGEFLAARPVDPYGGTIYLDDTGAVRTTSKFSTAHVSQRQDSAPD
jgi:hypothetical protein